MKDAHIAKRCTESKKPEDTCSTSLRVIRTKFGCSIYNWRASEASETLSGLFNRESRIYVLLYIVQAKFVLITCKEGGA